MFTVVWISFAVYALSEVSRIGTSRAH
jgi:hypothetical protein